MKFDTKDPYERIKLLQEKILRQRSALKSQQITILELQARLRKLEARVAVVVPKVETVDDLSAAHEINIRTYNCLIREANQRGVESLTVADLASSKQIDLMRLPNFGRVCLGEIAMVLRKRGMWFKSGGSQFIKVD